MCIDKNSKFFATTQSDISKAAVDFFSIGHILMGQIAYFIVYAIITWPLAYLGVDADLWAVIFSILIGIIWEPFENIILFAMGLKFENKRDSILNSVFDIIFVIIGAVISYFIHNWVVNLILIIVEFTLFLTIRLYFLKNAPKT
jgi:hypothetical protein